MIIAIYIHIFVHLCNDESNLKCNMRSELSESKAFASEVQYVTTLLKIMNSNTDCILHILIHSYVIYVLRNYKKYIFNT